MAVRGFDRDLAGAVRRAHLVSGVLRSAGPTGSVEPQPAFFGLSRNWPDRHCRRTSGAAVVRPRGLARPTDQPKGSRTVKSALHGSDGERADSARRCSTAARATFFLTCVDRRRCSPIIGADGGHLAPGARAGGRYPIPDRCARVRNRFRHRLRWSRRRGFCGSESGAVGDSFDMDWVRMRRSRDDARRRRYACVSIHHAPHVSGSMHGVGCGARGFVRLSWATARISDRHSGSAVEALERPRNRTQFRPRRP